MKPRQMLKIRKKEKDPEIRDRIMLNVLVERDEMSVTGAARSLGMAPSWGVKWRHRYLEGGMEGLQTRSRTGRPPRISKETMKEIKKSKENSLPDCRRLARSHTGGYRHRVHDRVCHTIRPRIAAKLEIHQKGSRWKTHEEGEQAEDRMVQEEDEVVDRGEETRGLHHMRARRDDRYGRCPTPEGNLYRLEYVRDRFGENQIDRLLTPTA